MSNGTKPSRSTYGNRNRRTGGTIGRFQPDGGSELKWKDTDYSFSSASPGVVEALVPTIILRGTGPSERVGTGVTLKSLQFNGLILNDPLTATNGSTSMRLYLVLDKECNGVEPGVAEIFTGTDLTQAMPEIANSARFVVIKSWNFAFNPNAGVSGAYSHQVRAVKYFAKCNIPMRWKSSDTSGTRANTTQNCLYFVHSATTTECNFQGTFRVRYRDKGN